MPEPAKAKLWGRGFRITSIFAWVEVHEKPLLALIVLVGVLLRFAAIATLAHQPESDELAYRAMALNWLSGQGIKDHMGNLAMYNAGYPIFILTPVFLLFPDNLFAVRFLQSLLGVICILLCHRIAAEVGAKAFGRLLAALLLGLYLPSAVYTVYLAKENLMTVLMLAAIYCLLCLIRTKSRGAAVSAGVCFGLLALTGNAALSLLLLLPYVLYCLRSGFFEKMRLAGLVLIPMLLVPTPWIVRNHLELGAPVLNTNGGFNLYLGNNPAATGMFVSISETPRGTSWAQLRQTGELNASQILKEDALTWIATNPSDFLKLAIKKLIYFWLPPFHQGGDQTSPLEMMVRVVWSLQFVVLVGGAVGSILNRSLRNHQGVRMLWLAIGSYTAVHMVFYVIFRYREPIMPILCILAALAVEQYLSERKAIYT